MTSRETVRDALTTLLDTALVGTGLPAQLVIGHKPTVSEIAKQSPVVAVMGAGSLRERQTFQGQKSAFFLTIRVWVVATDDDAGWTSADAEDALDSIESIIADTIDTNRSNAPTWVAIGYDGRTVAVDDEVFDGVPYLQEVIPLRVEVAG